MSKIKLIAGHLFGINKIHMINNTTGKRLLKMLFMIVSLFFWLWVVLMVLEHFERYATREKVISEYASPIIGNAEKADLKIYEETLPSAPRPPKEVIEKYPVLSTLEGASESTLLERAEQWEGLIFKCDEEGVILDRYSPQHALLASLLNETTIHAQKIADVLPREHPEYGADVQSRLTRAVDEWRNPIPRLPHEVGCLGPFVDYMIPLPDIQNTGFRFMFYPFQEKAKQHPLIYVVAVPWRWKTFFGGVRPNYYETEAYPQFPKSEFWTNSLGFRDEEIAVPKPQGVYRIVCIGGSTTVEGPRNDLTYPKTLQQLLRDYFQTPLIEVINCGVDGGIIRGQPFSFDDCLALEPNMVIHYNYVNDSGGIIDDTLTNTVLRSPWRSKIITTLANSRLLTRRWRTLWAHVMPGKSDYRQEIERIIVPPLLELCERTQKAGAHFAISSFAYPDINHLPVKERAWFHDHFWFQQRIKMQFEDYALSTDAFNEAVMEFCKQHDACYIPVAENIKGGLKIFTDHCHMHLAGIRKKADIVFESIKETVSKDIEASLNNRPQESNLP